MSHFYKTPLSLIPAGAVTFGLLLFMLSLVYTVAPPVEIAPPPQLFGIYQKDTPLKTFDKPEKVPKPTEAKEQPQRAPIDKFIPVNPVVSITPGFEKIAPGDITNTVLIDTDYIPVFVQQPRYPSSALRRGISGYAVIQITITSSGSARDPVLLEESPEGYGFGREALKAAKKLKYNPRVVDGIAREVNGVPYKYSFVISD